eukprot:TRINITY_DN21429_c0_g1_i1.p1 TRINITY_DN21429_c0_g1~~TRINITY_DN21429_c0_g1_i1.p1  ORF type:complete len:942 (+),score=249.02 TRINITY_DN21429_c0_g1_i1:62-2887(+)
MLLPAEGHTAVVGGDEVVVYGGKAADTGELLSTVVVLKARGEGDSWAAASYRVVPASGVQPPARCYHSATVSQGTMYVIHGLLAGDTRDPAGVLWALDLSSYTWRSVPTTGSAPSPRCHHTAALVGGTLFVAGGYPLGAEPSESDPQLFALDLASLVWSQVEPRGLPVPPRLWGHATVSWDGKLVMYGGVDATIENETESLWVWHCARRQWREVRFGDAAAQSQSVGASPPRTARPNVVRALWAFNAQDPRQLAFGAGDLVEITCQNLAKEGPEGWLKGKKQAAAAEGWFPGNYVEPCASMPPSPVVCPAVDGKVPPTRSAHAACQVESWGLLIWGGERGLPTVRHGDAWLLNLKTGSWTQVGGHGDAPAPAAGLPMVWYRDVACLVMPAMRAVHLLNRSLGTWRRVEMVEQADPPPPNACADAATASRRSSVTAAPSSRRPSCVVEAQQEPAQGKFGVAAPAPCRRASTGLRSAAVPQPPPPSAPPSSHSSAHDAAVQHVSHASESARLEQQVGGRDSPLGHTATPGPEWAPPSVPEPARERAHVSPSRYLTPAPPHEYTPREAPLQRQFPAPASPPRDAAAPWVVELSPRQQAVAVPVPGGPGGGREITLYVVQGPPSPTLHASQPPPYLAPHPTPPRSPFHRLPPPGGAAATSPPPSGAAAGALLSIPAKLPSEPARHRIANRGRQGSPRAFHSGGSPWGSASRDAAPYTPRQTSLHTPDGRGREYAAAPPSASRPATPAQHRLEMPDTTEQCGRSANMPSEFSTDGPEHPRRGSLADSLHTDAAPPAAHAAVPHPVRRVPADTKRVEAAPDTSPVHTRQQHYDDPGGPGGVRPNTGETVCLSTGWHPGCLYPGECGTVLGVSEGIAVRGPRGDVAVYRREDLSRSPPRAQWTQPGVLQTMPLPAAADAQQPQVPPPTLPPYHQEPSSTVWNSAFCPR